jgi:hypothetical protein
MAGQARGDDWQLVLIAWGEKYGSADVNALVREVHAQGRGPARTVLITDRPRPGLDAGIETRPHPQAFLLPWMKRSGCQAKLGMFAEGVLPTDLPAIFLDLDTLILGDVAQLLGAVADDAQIAILQSAILPFGAVARRLYRLTGGRRYARGNSSVVVFHPARCGFIAARFLDLVAQHPNGGFRPLIADERFISWVAQPRSAVAAAGEQAGILGRAAQRVGFVDGFLILCLGVAVIDHAAAGLDIERLVLQHRGAQCDAEIHLAIGGKIADTAAIDAALFRLQLVDDLHRPHLGRARDGAAGSPASSADSASSPSRISPTTFETMCMTWL